MVCKPAPVGCLWTSFPTLELVQSDPPPAAQGQWERFSGTPGAPPSAQAPPPRASPCPRGRASRASRSGTRRGWSGGAPETSSFARSVHSWTEH